MSRGALQKILRRSRYEKRTKQTFFTRSEKWSENWSSRFEPKILLISFSRGWSPPLPPLHNQIYSRFWYAFSLFLRKFHSINPFNSNICELGRAGSLRKRWNFHVRLSAKRILSYFQPNADHFRTRSGVMRWLCTMNVRNEPVQEMFCVVKNDTPPVCTWKFCEFQHRKSISIWGIDLIVWRGLIISEIGILSSGNQVSQFLLPFNHLYQACSGPGLREVPVDTLQLSGSRKICISFRNLEDENGKTESWRNTYHGVNLKKMRFVPGGFSCTNSPTSCTWWKVVDGFKRNIVSLPKHHIRISRVFATLMRPIVRNTECDPLVFTTPVGATHCFLEHLQFYQNPTD